MRSENTVKEPDNQTSQRFIRETACAPNHGKYVLWWYTHVRVYCSQISEVNPTLADFNVYLLFLLTRREEVSQAAQKAPHAPIVFFLIQQFVERTEELENWLGEADEIIRYQRLGKKKKKRNVEWQMLIWKKTHRKIWVSLTWRNCSTDILVSSSHSPLDPSSARIVGKLVESW